jgi:two-component system, CitB family, response regulator DctR
VNARKLEIRAPTSRVEARWSVVIVEDNPDVAMVHRRFIDATPDFRAVQVVSNAEAAYAAVQRLRPDLAIVDLTMPGGDGLTLLRRIRQAQIPLEAIVVTASRDAPTVREAMHLGVVDYLVKPFAPERLRQSLDAFARRVRALQRPQLDQADVDLVQSSGATRMQRLPKGLRRATFAAIVAALEQSDRPLSADEVGQAVDVARVTARRYLEYLEVIGAAEIERECRGPGRPRNRYRRSARRLP